MLGPDSSLGPRADRVRLEALAYGLALHGPTFATVDLVRALGRSPLWLEARSLLREHGFREYEINYLMRLHPQGCACWRCVKRLRAWALAHRKKLSSRI